MFMGTFCLLKVFVVEQAKRECEKIENLPVHLVFREAYALGWSFMSIFRPRLRDPNMCWCSLCKIVLPSVIVHSLMIAHLNDVVWNFK